MRDQRADLEWRAGGVPVSLQFDDPYFSLDNGLAETRHVFLNGNDLPARFVDGFAIAELGFGTGLNFLTTWAAWRAAGAPGAFRFTSFEAYPMAPEDMAAAHAAFPEVEGLGQALVENLSDGRAEFEDATLEVIAGDARKTLPNWQGMADAWYLDGFSPAKNPEMWGPDLMADVARHTNPKGTAATYTAAGFVRRGLEAAGFDVTRTPGFGRKRHMTRATLR
ncbi:MAG: tRNA (5-methylaminomethyl-2-thiouridine)(34)-methyltransferase MnmD [Pseudomonadota bacterium]